MAGAAGSRKLLCVQHIPGELFGVNGLFPRADVPVKAAIQCAMLCADDLSIVQNQVIKVGSTYNMPAGTNTCP